MAGYYIQDDPNQPVAIHLSIETLEKIGREVMTGFGKVPRRGAEAGGILLGSLQSGERPAIVIEDFTPVPIQYRFGPTYLLSDADEQTFSEAVAQCAAGELRPVGFVRSNTREETRLTAEDIALLDRHFIERPFTALLVRPFATRPSRAVFFTCAEGPFNLEMKGGPEFPFRRRELMPAAAAAAAGAVATRSERRAAQLETAIVAPGATVLLTPQPDTVTVEGTPHQTPAFAEPRSTWTWLPLSFVFLLLGVLLGFEAAGAYGNAPPPPEPYNLRLAVTRAGNNLTLKWDHASAAIRSARRGTLSIADGSEQRTIDLGLTELTSGSIVYAPSSPLVHFRLEVFPRDDASLSQTVDWKQ